ncbi:MAG: hypothetical protein DLM62_04780, partial [Pseudonocardiales bacterium]
MRMLREAAGSPLVRPPARRKDSRPVGKSATNASVQEVIAVEPVIRRVVAARAANPSDIDDLVQDCLERLLAAHGRLAPDAVLPYAIVTARNLVSSHATTAARRARAAELLTMVGINADRLSSYPHELSGGMR